MPFISSSSRSLSLWLQSKKQSIGKRPSSGEVCFWTDDQFYHLVKWTGSVVFFTLTFPIHLAMFQAKQKQGAELLFDSLISHDQYCYKCNKTKFNEYLRPVVDNIDQAQLPLFRCAS